MNPTISSPEISVKTVEDFKLQVGEEIGSGDFATVWEKRDSKPRRVYKVIKTKDFDDGTEAKIAKIAGEIGVGPIVHDVFYVGESLAVIEMDYAGKTLGHWMEELAAKNTEPRKELPLPHPIKGGMIVSRYTVTEIPRKERASMDDTVASLYKEAETFYFQLFTQLKKLAKRMISYGDTHVGNIIPIPESEVKLIDWFGINLDQFCTQM